MKSVGIADLTFFYGPATADEIKVGVHIHSPIVFHNSITNEPDGPGVDYIRAMIKEMGHTAEIMVLPLSRIMLYLKTSQIDMTLEFGETEDRKAFVYYSDLPVLITTPSLAVLKGSKPSKINSIKDLRGITMIEDYLNELKRQGF
ncbi:extracellular solute-binding protein, family 3 [Desulfosarcina variabilis str. Montpellier]|uniref:substrate-binding periplasmic protein n=1 Tax=Desulfosarcina variabilis TaxID=2300 RepID=UPI003AFB3389